MKATREERRIIDRLRRRHGKRNGVVPNCFLDHPKLIRNCTRKIDAAAPEPPRD